MSNAKVLRFPMEQQAVKQVELSRATGIVESTGSGLSFIHNSDNSNGDGPTHGMRFAPELEAEIDLPNKHGAS